MKRACASCQHWDGVYEPDNGGLCRRNAAVFLVTDSLPPELYEPVGHWPRTFSWDWCGEWVWQSPEYADGPAGRLERIKPVAAT